MDIAALSILKSQAQMKQSVGIAVIKKAIDSAGQNADIVSEMLEKVEQGKVLAQALATPHLGRSIDILV